MYKNWISLERNTNEMSLRTVVLIILLIILNNFALGGETGSRTRHWDNWCSADKVDEVAVSPVWWLKTFLLTLPLGDQPVIKA